ncbi:MAG: glycoside hydrolase family 32 protein [Saprospiraceae bacterium]
MKKISTWGFVCSLFFFLLLSSCQDQATTNSTEEESVDTYYQEQHRPQFHFSPPTMWMNDPNGMVYYEGEYHLFYQHYPDSNVWGPMHWGHAVSPDLVHWENLPIALYPDTLGYIFSGSAVIDWNNTSGLGETEGDSLRPPMIAIYTYHDTARLAAGRNDFQTQGIAYSTDKGRSWEKYAGNPVIPNTEKIRDFRDPKVIWSEEYQKWIMVFAADDRSRFYSSPNLIDWKFLSDWGADIGAHGGVWECPDFFPMTDQKSGATKWVLIQSLNPGGPNGGSATQYFIGDFDGENFQLDPDFQQALENGNENAMWIDYGRDNYAGVTWSDIPKADGRRIFLGWMSNWNYARVVPTEIWRSAMTIPRTLSLRQTSQGYRLLSQAVQELTQLRISTNTVESQTLDDTLDLSELATPLMEIEVELDFPENGECEFGIELFNDQGETYRIGFDQAQNQYYSDRRKAGKIDFSDQFGAKLHLAPAQISSSTRKLHLFIDKASIELFADDGTLTMTDIFFPTLPFNGLRFYAQGGEVSLTEVKIYSLKSIW